MNLRPSNISPSPAFLPEELVAEVLSILPVKTLLRLRCVSKSWNSIISNPIFVKCHLNRSAGNADLTLVSSWREAFYTFIGLFENTQIIINVTNHPFHQLIDKNYCFHMIVGSCNGLLCLLSENKDKYLRIWNPATRTISEILGHYSQKDLCYPPNLSFGYDDSTDTYKVVYFVPNKTHVRVFSLAHKVWRNIQNSPIDHDSRMNVVNVSGSLNWLAIHNFTNKGPIISLDLSRETHTRFLLPRGFDEKLIRESKPRLSVLNDCLCFSHDLDFTHFVIWKMKEFGVEDSWTQFLKISYYVLQIYEDFRLMPLCFSDKCGTLLLTSKLHGQAILYNCRDNKAEIIKECWPYDVKDYVESLVWYC